MTTPIILVIGILVLIIVVLYNGIVGAKNSVKESFSAIDTVLQNRYNLIPNLVEVVKKYATHEADIFANVSEMRSKLTTGSHEATSDRFNQENALYSGMKSLFAVAENYPDLKASTNFLDLQNQWTEIEDRLQ